MHSQKLSLLATRQCLNGDVWLCQALAWGSGQREPEYCPRRQYRVVHTLVHFCTLNMRSSDLICLANRPTPVGTLSIWKRSCIDRITQLFAVYVQRCDIPVHFFQLQRKVLLCSTTSVTLLDAAIVIGVKMVLFQTAQTLKLSGFTMHVLTVQQGFCGRAWWHLRRHCRR